MAQHDNDAIRNRSQLRLTHVSTVVIAVSSAPCTCCIYSVCMQGLMDSCIYMYIYIHMYVYIYGCSVFKYVYQCLHHVAPVEVATVNEVGISDWSPISLPCASVPLPKN